ncbi:MAG: glycosyltransferase [Candidatus Peribacteraceae bacterium]|nr:glycosyltransferase [Candidatus Peribacteraceae bacterium]
MAKPKFSVAVIARNEELTLPRLVGSLKEFQERGGNIYVLDTGSTDKTVEVAKNLGCIVEAVGDKYRINIDEDTAKNINEKFIVEGEVPILKAGDSLFDFGSARNFAANLSETDMVAMPDCDEVYTKMDLDKLDKAIEEGFEQLEYNFVFSHDHLGNPIIKFRHCKFYDRRKMKWNGIIHEILGGETKRTFLGEDIIKLEHYQNEQTDRTGYIKGLAIDCYNHPENDRNSHYFARELFYFGRTNSAIKEFKNHISMNKWPTEASQSMLYVGDCYKKLGDTGEMLKWYSLSVEKEARREPLMRMAEYYFGRGMHRQTIAYAEAALTITQLPFYSNHQPYYEHAPHELLYVAYWHLGDKVKSKEHWKKAINFMPSNPKYLSDAQFYNDTPKECSRCDAGICSAHQLPALPKISFVIPTLGREEGLKRCLESIKNLNYPQDKIEVIVKQDSFENNTGVPKLVKQGVEESTGEWVVFASNDTAFAPESINEALRVGELGYVAFNTGEVSPDEGNINEHFMIRKDIIEKIGEVFDTDFYHVGVDNLLWAKMKKLGIFIRADKAVVEHFHFTKGAPMDDTYKQGWKEERVAHDRALLEEKLAELNK